MRFEAENEIIRGKQSIVCKKNCLRMQCGVPQTKHNDE